MPPFCDYFAFVIKFSKFSENQISVALQSDKFVGGFFPHIEKVERYGTVTYTNLTVVVVVVVPVL
jgi:hypothetical protein